MKHLLCALILCMAESAAASAAPTRGWRTDGTGTYPQATPPVEWSATKNVLWKAPMPSWSNSTPVLAGDRLFVCAEPATLLCVDARNGKILWQKPNTCADTVPPQERAKALAAVDKARRLAAALRSLRVQLRKVDRSLRKAPNDTSLQKKRDALKARLAECRKEFQAVAKFYRPPTHKVNGYSTPTPVTDGAHVWALFGNGVVACYDLDGRRRWIQIIEKTPLGHGHSASPTLVGDKLLVHIRDLVALDKATGKELWRTPTRVRFGTAVAARVGDVDVLVTPGGAVVRVSDGKVLAAVGANLPYCAPVVHGDTVYLVRSGGAAARLSPGPDRSVVVRKLWTTKPKRDRYYASPVFHDGLLYAITRASHFSVIDAKTGKVVYEKKLRFGRGEAYPSIAAAGDFLFVSHDSGTTLVMKPGRKPEVVATNKLELFRSCPVFQGDRMYVRTYKHLYCIGKK